MLRLRHSDPRLNRRIVVVRSLFVLLALAFSAVVIYHALDVGMPDSVPSTSRRRGGPRLVTWDAAPFAFARRLLVGLLTGLGVLAFVGLLAEKLVVHRFRVRPPRRPRYPY